MAETIEGRFSVTSDHKPVYMNFTFEDEGKGKILLAFTYNMSFASDLGLSLTELDKINTTEDFLLRQIPENAGRRSYWINAANLVVEFFKKKPHIMYFQEMNDRLKIGPPFSGGYQALLELLSDKNNVTYCDTLHVEPTGSYYTTGTFGKYSFVAYSIEKMINEVGSYPTILTVWDHEVLGNFEKFYGNDLGLHPHFKAKPTHLGRNFSCVRTTHGVNLINLHGPHTKEDALTMLKPAIEDYIQEAYTFFGKPYVWKTVIGGDTNDQNDAVKVIKFEKEKDHEIMYEYVGHPPLSCCAKKDPKNGVIYTLNPKKEATNTELLEDYNRDPKLHAYKLYGDKFWVEIFKHSDSNPDMFKNRLYIPDDDNIKYGGNRRSHNKKKKKSIKKQKSIKKRRITRRKTRTHKRKHK